MVTIRSQRAPGAGAQGLLPTTLRRFMPSLVVAVALAGPVMAQGVDPAGVATPAANEVKPIDARPASTASATDASEVPLELRDPAAGKSNLWYFQTSLYTRHFHPDERHDNHQKLLNLEYWRDDGCLAGLALFHNSFGQASQYVYIGKRWRPFDAAPAAYVKLTGGLLHGYKGEFKDKIPFNSSGVAPALIPAIGYSGKRFSTELTLFGLNGMMWSVGVFLY